MSLDNIFAKPYLIDGIGLVNPILLKDWDIFDENITPLMLSKKHIELSIDIDLPILDRIVFGLQDERLIRSLCEIFNLVFKSSSFQILVNDNSYFFINENNQIINSTNYDELRKIIFHQNILIEPKVYKNKQVQEWAEKVLKARNKNAANITMEDMVTTVAVMSGKHYWDLEKYSIYQLKSEFQRINKIKVYDTTSILYANPYAASEVKLDHFAEYLDLYADPYADIFKPKNKLKISKAIQG